MPRVVSLLASATEIVCALGRQGDLVGRSHECDFPLDVKSLPVCTRPRFPIDGTSAEIDAHVKALLAAGEPIYEVDPDLMRELRPDVILTQSQCVVCAVSDEDVARAMIPGLEPKPRVVSLAPNHLRDVWASIGEVAEALGVADRGQTAIAELQGRMKAIACDLRESYRSSVACLEWLDPLMAAGNWTPELVTMAGGRNVFGVAGQHSPWMTWNDLLDRNPDIIIAMPCGFDLERTHTEMRRFTEHPCFQDLRAVQNDRIFIADGNQFFNRPGPRLVESLEILAEIVWDGCYPPIDRFGHEGTAWRRLELPYGKFIDALRGGKTLAMDGAMGTELIRRGFTDPTWMANGAAFSRVYSIHEQYAEAGAEVLVTNSLLLGAARDSEDGLAFFGRQAVGAARSVVPKRWLLGSLGPMSAAGPNFSDREAVLECVAALSGVHGILLETCSDESAFTATEWIRSRWPDLPVLVSFAFAPNEDAKAIALARLAELSDIAALGVNCGREQSPADVGRTLRLFRKETSKPLFARPNAGTPKGEGEAWVYPHSPEEWATETAKLCDIGLAMVGGCCGTTPEHIRRLNCLVRKVRNPA